MPKVKHKRAIWNGVQVPLCQKFKKRYKDLSPLYTDEIDKTSCKPCIAAYRAGVPQRIGAPAPNIRRWWEDD